MYKLLLVEDEDIIREGLLTKIKYHHLNISEYYEAADGKDALTIIDEVNPDIVVTDIKLIKMDGLSLIEQAQINHSNIKFIIISGYPDFEYAKRAIKLGVIGYLVKPVGIDEIKTALMNAIKLIDAKRGLEHETKQLMTQNRSLELTEYINSALYGGITANQKNELKRLGKYYILSCVSFTKKTFGASNFTSKDLDVIKYAVSNLVTDLVYSGEKIVFNNIKNDHQLYILFSGNNMEQVTTEIEAFYQILLSILNQSLGIYCYIFISDNHDNISNILIEEIAECYGDLNIDSNFGVYKYSSDKKNKAEINIEHFKSLKNCIINKYTSQIQDAISRFFIKPKSTSNNFSKLTNAYYKTLFLKIADMITEIATDLDLKTNVDHQIRTTAMNIFELYDNEKEIENDLYQKILSLIRTDNLEKENVRIINRIKLAQQYIIRNYDKNLSVNELAETFEINPNYFSSVFKKEVGQSVVNFITEVRMNHACNLLKSTNISIVEISKLTGFENPNYFFRTFKKFMGITPAEYRNNVYV